MMTVDQLMALDMSFCEEVSKKGAQAWANHFIDDGIMVVKSGDNIVTEASIYEAMKPFFAVKGNTLMWSPEGGSLSDDGTLGYTYGKYIRTVVVEGKKEQQLGRYMTIWREIKPGTYKIEIDMGN